MSTTLTVGMSDAKANFSKLTAEVNRTGRPVTVFKNNRPWVEIRPLAAEENIPSDTREAMAEADAIVADPNHQTYRSANELFSALDI